MQVVRTFLEGQAPWVLKDPRMCLSAPLWMDALEAPLCIIGYKNPREVGSLGCPRTGEPAGGAVCACAQRWELLTLTPSS
jgi:hypothetical protein